MSAWRPEGWETVQPGLRLYKGKPVRNTRQAFEAGADAMLEAVCEEIEETGIEVQELRALKKSDGYFAVGVASASIEGAKTVAQAQREKILARFRGQ